MTDYDRYEHPFIPGSEVYHKKTKMRGTVVPFPENPKSLWPRDLFASTGAHVEWRDGSSGLTIAAELEFVPPIILLAECGE